MVPQRPDGTHAVRREPAEEVPGHLSVRLRDATTGAALWDELQERVRRSGSAQGVRIFRVDNPHTKPFPFWEWVIARDQARASRTCIFLAEAFTRPKVMHRLAKLGFTQSYTYFTWRNTQARADRVLHRAHARPRRASTSARTSGRTRPTSCPSTCRRRARRRSWRGWCSPRRSARATASTARRSSCWSTSRASPAARSISTPRSTSCAHWDLERADSLRAFIARVNRIRRENPALQSDRDAALPRRSTTTS